MKYLIELGLVDGCGENTTYKYFLIHSTESPVDSRGKLTQDGIVAMKGFNNEYGYPYGINSGFHNWRVISKGSTAEQLYNIYVDTVSNMVTLKDSGVKIPGGFDR